MNVQLKDGLWVNFKWRTDARGSADITFYPHRKGDQYQRNEANLILLLGDDKIGDATKGQTELENLGVCNVDRNASEMQYAAGLLLQFCLQTQCQKHCARTRTTPKTP